MSKYLYGEPTDNEQVEEMKRAIEEAVKTGRLVSTDLTAPVQFTPHSHITIDCKGCRMIVVDGFLAFDPVPGYLAAVEE